MTVEQAAAQSLERSSYSFLLEYGELAFGFGYAAWVSLSSAAFAILCCCFLITLPNRILALGLHYATYASEVYRAGLANIQRGQWEASIALNLTPYHTFRDVIIPQAIPPVVPALGIVSCFALIFTVESRVLIFFGWYLVGAIVLYIVYGMRNSELAKGHHVVETGEPAYFPEDEPRDESGKPVIRP